MKRKKPAKRRTEALAKAGADPKQLNLFEALDAGAALGDAKPVKPRRTRKALAKAALPEGRAPILTPPEAAAFLNVSVPTLKAWRAKKVGPSWRRCGAAGDLSPLRS
jgi:hypothetical protein